MVARAGAIWQGEVGEMFHSFECELKTEAEYFAQWFHMTVFKCAPFEISIDNGRGMARLKASTSSSTLRQCAEWELITHDFQRDEEGLSPEAIDMRHVWLVTMSLGPNWQIGYEARPPAPGRLQVELYKLDIDDVLQEAWDCMLDEIRKTYSLTDAPPPAPTIRQIAAAESLPAGLYPTNILGLRGRQLDVTNMISLGKEKRVIAEQQVISEATVKVYQDRITARIKEIEGIPTEQKVHWSALVVWLQKHGYPRVHDA